MQSNNYVVFNGREYDICDSAVSLQKVIPDFDVILFNKGDAQGTTITKDDLLSYKAPILISVTTSLDTPIGKIQTKKFNEMLAPFTDQALLWSVSSDLPFNINRFFEEENIQTLSGASDYLNNTFGKNFGVMVEEVRLLVRGVFVIDRMGILRYSEVPIKIQTELNYDMAINVLYELINEDSYTETEQEELL